MQISAKEEQRLDVRAIWAKRVKVFVDTDAGFHPNQSKTELERDQPFVVALQQIGSQNFTGTSASGVNLIIKHEGRDLSIAQLRAAYITWLKDMHATHDEEFVFVDEAIYIFDHRNAWRELDLRGKKPLIIFHKHMKDSKDEWKVDNQNPIRIKLPKAVNGPKAELYVTVEYFFHDGAEDELGEVKFLCRAVGIDEANGCKIVQNGNSSQFLLNKSICFKASLLTTATRLDDSAWKKKLEDVLNKSPSYVEVLKEEDSKKFGLSEIFPRDRIILEAGFTFPKEILVVVRPKKGVGPTFKQGMIVAEAMAMTLTVRHCSCADVCLHQKTSVSSSDIKEDHARVVCKISTESTVTKVGVKGLYMFSIGTSEDRRLLKQGTYIFQFALESEKYKHVVPALSSIQIVPSSITSKWTVCDHSEECRIADHLHKPVIRLQEPVKDLFIRKYDAYDNRQNFDKPLEVEVNCVALEGESLQMHSLALATPDGRQTLRLKNVVFRNGQLEKLDKQNEAILRVLFPGEQHAEIKCKVFPGAITKVQVKASDPLIHVDDSMSFLDALLPDQIIDNLAVEGLDSCGNKTEKGHKVRVLLDGLAFQDNRREERQLDENGMLQLGGLLKVTCHFNSTGSIRFISNTGSTLYTINFKTVTRHLIASQVPRKSYIGRRLNDISLKIIDENGNIDTAVDGYTHSVTVDWLKGVTFPFNKGECTLQGIVLPKKPGLWTGKVFFSANKSLSVTLLVELELATACSLGPAMPKLEKLTAQSGVPTVFPFTVYDEDKQPALLTKPMKELIKMKAERRDCGAENDSIIRPCSVEDKKIVLSKTAAVGAYEAEIIITGSVGSYTITLMDPSLELSGQAELVCNLQHGKVAKILPTLSSGTVEDSKASIYRPIQYLEATRCSPFPSLTVTLLDAEDNVCSSCEGRKITVKILNCPQWRVLETKVIQGVAKLEIASLVVPVGKYQVCIELADSLDDVYSIDEQVNQVKAHFALTVNHGNYPSALRFCESNMNCSTICISLTEQENQYLPGMTVIVESADGKRLQRRPTVGVKLHPVNPVSTFGFKEYCGSVVKETGLGFEDEPAVKYEFTQVGTPFQAGEYMLEFYVAGTDVLPLRMQLTVNHGPPSQLEIVQRELGKQMDVLQVNLLDAERNKCEDVSGMEIYLELVLSSNVISDWTPCLLLSKSTAIVDHGTGDFGVFHLSHGAAGVYTLKVLATEYWGQLVKPAETQVYIDHGNTSESIMKRCTDIQALNQKYNGRLGLISELAKEIEQKQATRQSLERQIGDLQAALKFKDGERNQVLGLKQAANDDEILEELLRQKVRTQESVISDLERLTHKGIPLAHVALAFWEAQSGANFLSSEVPDLGAKDLVGLVVLLARVENDSLNRMLSEFMGLRTLLMIVTRTERGLSALESYGQNGLVDETRGLIRFAHSRNYNMFGRYDVMVLMDISPYKRSDRKSPVDRQHPQKLLNIDPPLLRDNQVPQGFLGYAVNLLHLSSEHLTIRVQSRSDPQRKDIGLRETLFFNILGLLQVYDNRLNMYNAKATVKHFQGAISLDGAVIRKQQRHQLGRCRDNFPVCFAGVPPQERINTCLIPPQVRYAMERLKTLKWIESRINIIHDSLTDVKQRLKQEITQLGKLESKMSLAQTEKYQLIESCKLLNIQMAELKRVADVKRAADALAARSGAGTTRELAITQGGDDSKRMRAFMMGSQFW